MLWLSPWSDVRLTWASVTDILHVDPSLIFCKRRRRLTPLLGICCSTGFILWHFCSHFEFSDLVLKLHLDLLWGDVSNSESSGFADLHCSGLESVIYKESKTSHVFLKSGSRMSLVFEAERSYENYILASSWLLGSV